MPLVSTATSVGQQHNNSTDNNSVTPLANLHSQVWSVLIFSLSFCCCFFNNLVVVHRPTHFRRLFQPCHIIPWQDPSDYRFSAFFFTHSHGHVQSVGHRGFSLHFSFVFLFFFVLRGRLYRWWTFPTQHENFASMQKKKNRLKGRRDTQSTETLKEFSFVFFFFFFCSFFRREIKWNLLKEEEEE